VSFVSRNDRGSEALLWADLVKWMENERLFGLCLGHHVPHLPKRAIADAEAASAFRELLRTHIVTET
jgi:hypothetical protein